LFSASASFCPNACSRPQIADFGIIAASIVNITDTNAADATHVLNRAVKTPSDFLLREIRRLSQKNVSTAEAVHQHVPLELFHPQRPVTAFLSGA
jgi:sulfite reductase beta subunit-like hemoprotein